MFAYLLAVGSNLGNSQQTIEMAARAIDRLDGTKVAAQSRLHPTVAVGGPAGQGEFLNGAMVVESSLPADALLGEFQTIENSLGRKPCERWSARTIDLDILLAGDQVIEADRLTIPHPRMSYRPFVLGPAVEVAGDWRHPLLEESLEELWARLQDGDNGVLIYGGGEADRRRLAGELCDQFPSWSCVEMSSSDKYWLSAGEGPGETPSPKLAIQLRTDDERPTPGLPTIVLPTGGGETGLQESVAAIQGIWPDLGRAEPTG